jgi:hypothetical protein
MSNSKYAVDAPSTVELVETKTETAKYISNDGDRFPLPQSNHQKSRRSSAFSASSLVSFMQHQPSTSSPSNLSRCNSAFTGLSQTMIADPESSSDSDDSDLDHALSSSQHHHLHCCNQCLRCYHVRARRLSYITRNALFDQFIVLIIVTAGILVGVQTYQLSPQVVASLDVADSIILAIFTVEVILKMIAEGRRPWIYFQDHWNKFDFIIVLAAYTPGVSGQANLLRLLRLLRVLKLVRALPQLQIIVVSIQINQLL